MVVVRQKLFYTKYQYGQFFKQLIISSGKSLETSAAFSRDWLWKLLRGAEAKCGWGWLRLIVTQALGGWGFDWLNAVKALSGLCLAYARRLWLNLRPFGWLIMLPGWWLLRLPSPGSFFLHPSLKQEFL